MLSVETISQAFEPVLEKLQPLSIYLSAHPKAHIALILLTLILLFILLSISRKNKLAIRPVPKIAEIKFPAASTNLNKTAEKDIQAIAGDDVFATQLDLAKAYIEMNQKLLAKNMLENVLQQGSVSQKNEARQLTQAL
jgi:FimV-like protein